MLWSIAPNSEVGFHVVWCEVFRDKIHFHMLLFIIIKLAQTLMKILMELYLRFAVNITAYRLLSILP